MYELWICGKRYMTPKGTSVDMYPWQIEGNECWEEVTAQPAKRWQPDESGLFYAVCSDGSISMERWGRHSGFDVSCYKLGNVFRTEQEAQEEVKRRESIANAWWPERGCTFYRWSFDGETLYELYNDWFTADAYIGACHPTKEACEAWAKEYAHLFAKKPTDANQ